MKEPYLDGLPTPSAFYDPKESCWRMSQATLLSEVSELLPNLPAWGTTANGALYELPTPEPLTAERDFSSGRNLPTPAAGDCKTFGPNVDWEKRQNHAASVSSVLMNLLFDDGNK